MPMPNVPITAQGDGASRCTVPSGFMARTPPAARSVESDSASHQAVEVLPLVPVTASTSSRAEGLS
jgi:hypothetical protein